MPGKDTIHLAYDTPPAAVTGWWIWDSPAAPADGMVTCLFRRTFEAAEVGAAPVLHISADSRYRAYLNGQLISRGPCRGVIDHYHYETVDLAGRLRPGRNVLAVEVRWYGPYAPWAEVHIHPGLWVMLTSGEGRAAKTILTDEFWRVWRSDAHTRHPLPTSARSEHVRIVDPCEDVDARKLPAGWQEATFDDTAWAPAVRVEAARARYAPDRHMGLRHELIPREIPPMEEVPFPPAGLMQFGTLRPARPPEEARQIEGALCPAAATPPPFWGQTARPLRLEGAGTHYVIVNLGKLMTGYPRLTLTAPAGTMVELRYAEALSRNLRKGIRDDPAGTVEGYLDLFTCREGSNTFEPFVWRAARFLRIAVHHPAGPAELTALEPVFTAYLFRPQATFESSDPQLKPLWDTSWWTARLCAHEHYEDCPYYEQLQYVGDTRLQALVSYLVAGDFRLARQALRQWARTRRPDGITLSRTPSSAAVPQIIVNFSLIWVEMLEDYYRYSGDASLPAELMGAVEDVLGWFDQFDHDGVLSGVPYWVFTDWSIPIDERHCAGTLGELNLRRVGALQAAARLAEAAGDESGAAEFARRARRAAAACRKKLWSPADKLFRDDLNGAVIGEHTSLLAILYGLVTPRQGRAMIERMEARQDLRRPTIYYSYYAFRAYQKLGLYERAWQRRLHIWQDMLALHATTWFECPEPSRSDCHAWGSWIMCDLLTSVLGVTPARPGFASVRVAPKFLGELEWARGRIPTRQGPVSVEWRREGDRIRCRVELPANVDGVLVSPAGRQHPLTGGCNEVTLNP